MMPPQPYMLSKVVSDDYAELPIMLNYGHRDMIYELIKDGFYITRYSVRNIVPDRNILSIDEIAELAEKFS